MSISLEAEKTTATSKTQSTGAAIGSETDAASARSWLESLSPEECAAALSFRDAPFLASFLDLASSSVASSSVASSSPKSLPHPLSLLTNLAFDLEDLKMSVDEKEWEQSLSRQGEEGPAEAAATTVSEDTAGKEAEEVNPKEVHDLPTAQESVEKDEKNVQASTGKEETGVDDLTSNKSGEDPTEDKAKEEADVFRIRGEEAKESSVSLETAKEADIVSEGKGLPADGVDAKADVGVAENSNKTEKGVAFSKAAKEFAENIAVVDPAGAGMAGDIPFVAIRPAFLKTKGTGDCIRSLDSIIQTLSPSSGFLSPDFIPQEYLDTSDNGEGSLSIEKLCLQRVQSLMKSASDNNAPVMLFLFLLVRIEVAAYLAFKGKGGKKKTGLVLPTRENLEILSKQMEALEEDNKSNVLGKATMEMIAAPMTEAGYCSLQGNVTSDGKLQNLLVMSFPTLIKLFSSTDASNRPDFQKWNKAWNATIKNLLEFSRQRAPSTPSKAPTTSPTQASPTPITPTPTKSLTIEATSSDKGTPNGLDMSIFDESTTPASSSSKKKKKRKKKNKKKNGNAGNNHNGGEVSSPKNSQPTKEPTVNAVPGQVTKKNSEEKAEKDSEPKPAELAKEEATADAPQDNQIVKANNADATSPIASGNKSPTAKAPATDEKGNSKTAPVSAIETSRSFESSDESESSVSARHETEEADTLPPGKSAADKGDFTVSRVHGVGTVVVAPSTPSEPPMPSSGTEQNSEGDVKGENAPADDNHDEWETVEVKGRGNRKKGGRGNAQQAVASNASNQQSGSKKSKSSTRNSAARKRVAHRKMVKDILSNVLDNVDDEVRRRWQQEARLAKTAPSASPAAAPAPTVSAWKARTPGGAASDGKKKEKTLRDVVVGKKPAATPPKTTTPKKASQPVAKAEAKSKSNVGGKGPASQSSPPPTRTKPKNGAGASPMKASKGTATTADQNTASTIPETVSAVSDPKRATPRAGRDITRSDSSSADTDENPKPEERASTQTQGGKTSSPEPPLPTLLNPGNVNSASSSVASSLEAPHATSGHHHTSTSNEVDVGYHLLDVCDRLTRDMHVFMARRASALNTRRRERGALLGALQDTVSSIWAGHSHVELYGSCATMLDLPSSDLDVVVCGLDQMEATMSVASSPQHSVPSFSRSVSEGLTPDKMMPDPPMRHTSMPHFVPLHLNADRVVRLGAELERQPWAVHVKAIPTASVPVVKVLADPTRLPGAVPPSVLEGEEWMMQHHHAASQTANQNGTESATPPPADYPSAESPTSSPHYQPQAAMAPVWRGSDVINGLLQIDITFEGPEHGGIGSTEFSARVVQNVCDETGLVAESTAFVQVIMVVKELLAQRRLNEPFSGGLSSYALLLLVLAVMCERKGVREELERVEMQRRVVAAGGGNSEMSGAPSGVELVESADDQRPPPVEAATTSTPKPNAPNTKGNTNSPPTPTPKSNAVKGKSDKGTSPASPQKPTAAGSKGDNKGNKQTPKNAPQAGSQGTKQTPKHTPQANAHGGKQSGKNNQQSNTNAQGTKQGGKMATQAPAQGGKKGAKSPQNNLHGQGPKQTVKSSPQPNAPGSKQAKNQQGGKNANQARGGNSAGNQQRGTNQQRRAGAGGNQPQGGNAGKANNQNGSQQSQKKAAKSPGNSWASIAMGQNKAGASKGGKKQESVSKKNAQPSKPSSFADAVARRAGNAKGNAPDAASATKASAQAPSPKAKQTTAAATAPQSEGEGKKSKQKHPVPAAKTEEKPKISPQKQPTTTKSPEKASAATDQKKDANAVSDKSVKVEKENERKIEADEKTSKFNNYSSEPVEQPMSTAAQSAFPQGFNDVIEVLCSGETTPGKLLMHFLLFYGQHFDAHATSIDISGKHHREMIHSYLSPYIQRRSAGTIDPITGMLTVDPIVVYDPLEGAENNNVARRCFLWSSVKWVFAQSYMTLSSAAERNTTPPGTPGAITNEVATGVKTTGSGSQVADPAETAAWNGPYSPTDKGSLYEPPSALLELLLSF